MLLARLAAAYSAKHFNNSNISVTNVISLLLGGIRTKCDSSMFKKCLDTLTCNTNTSKMETLVELQRCKAVYKSFQVCRLLNAQENFYCIYNKFTASHLCIVYYRIAQSLYLVQRILMAIQKFF